MCTTKFRTEGDYREYGCPSDRPAGITAGPTRVLWSHTGDGYCALICKADAECGTGTCQRLKKSGDSIFGRDGCQFKTTWHRRLNAPLVVKTLVQRWQYCQPTTPFGRKSYVYLLCFF